MSLVSLFLPTQWDASIKITVYMVSFAVVLFSWISRVGPRKNFCFNIWLCTVMKTSQKSRNLTLAKFHKQSKTAKISVCKIYGVYSICHFGIPYMYLFICFASGPFKVRITRDNYPEFKLENAAMDAAFNGESGMLKVCTERQGFLAKRPRTIFIKHC